MRRPAVRVTPPRARHEVEAQHRHGATRDDRSDPATLVARPRTAGRRPAAEPRARPDLALLARACRRSSPGCSVDHGRPARVHRPRRQGRGRDERSFARLDQRRRSSRSSSSRRSARSATTRSRAGAAASRTSSSARSSTSSSSSASPRATRSIAIAAFIALLQFSSNFAQGPFQGYVPDLVPAPQVGTGQRAGRADAGARRRRRASSIGALATAIAQLRARARSRSASSSS